MTIAKAERITGISLKILWHPKNHLTLIAERSNGERFPPFVHKRKTCTPASKQINQMAQEFVDWNYKLNSETIFSRQGHRCAKCGAMKPLQAHHKKHRSQGRDDRVENLVGLCGGCHENEHRP